MTYLNCPWVWERKFELDFTLLPTMVIDLYYQKTKNEKVFTKTVKDGFLTILNTFKKELDHENKSDYWFLRPDDIPEHSPQNGGYGAPYNNDIDLVWSAFRPSDDVCIYNYFIPGNQFVVLALNILAKYLDDSSLIKEVKELSKKINDAIQKHAIVDHEKYGKIYAYEIDGLGNYNLMDDANIPSLLALPYLKYIDLNDPIYQNTRRFILSKDNPFYYEGTYAKGVGSPHTPDQYIWHISLIGQALTTENKDEKSVLLKTILNTHANTHLMHEGFDVNNPNNFTREWFSWANSLFAYFIDENFDNLETLMK